jgi:hypothetical protein
MARSVTMSAAPAPAARRPAVWSDARTICRTAITAKPAGSAAAIIQIGNVVDERLSNFALNVDECPCGGRQKHRNRRPDCGAERARRRSGQAGEGRVGDGRQGEQASFARGNHPPEHADEQREVLHDERRAADTGVQGPAQQDFSQGNRDHRREQRGHGGVLDRSNRSNGRRVHHRGR